jgi:hypothetical protein
VKNTRAKMALRHGSNGENQLSIKETLSSNTSTIKKKKSIKSLTI